MTLCLTCRNEHCCIEPDLRKIRSECEYYRPITNADRIRSMTDEELAEFLQKNHDRSGCRALTTESYICDFYKDDLNTDCKKCWLDWLKQE